MATSLSLALLASLQLAASIGFQLLVLAALGLGPASDAFVAAQAVPVVLTAILASSMQSAWQARLATAPQASGAWRQAHRTAHAQALMAFGFAGAVISLGAPWWLVALYGGLDPSTRELVLQMTPVLLLAGLFNGAGAVLTIAQRGRDRLLSVEVVTLAASLASLAAVGPALEAWGVTAAAGVLLARAAMTWLLIQGLVGATWPDWKAGWRDRKAWVQLRPLLAGSAAFKTAPLVDRFWTAMAPTGSLTLFSLAQTGTSALAAVLERSLCMPVGPAIARSVAEQAPAAVRRLYRRAVMKVAGAICLAGLILALVGPWWPQVVSAGLNLSEDRALELWVLCGLLLGHALVAAAVAPVVAVFYAIGDTRTPALVGLVSFVAGVLAKSIGFLWMGIDGLALATSMYYLVHLAALIHGAERRINRMQPASLNA